MLHEPSAQERRTPQSAARRLRASALSAIRQYFVERQFLEVDTPLLVDAPGSESSLEPMRVERTDGRPAWLITSPEHHMKRLLCDGEQRIFQICRCFRAEEATPHHRAEFTMVEWYRRDADYQQIATDVEHLVLFVANKCGLGLQVGPADALVDLSSPWPQWSVADAFAEFAQIELTGPEDPSALRRAAQRAHMSSVTDEDDWETAFYKILLERVEPALARTGRGVHLLDWPAPMAALARLKEDDLSVAERVESYAGGLELANGFSELTDPRQQRRRFDQERRRRRKQQRDVFPVDESFLRGLAMGMPSSAGVALGLDRLLLLIGPYNDLHHVAPHFMEHREKE